MKKALLLAPLLLLASCAHMYGRVDGAAPVGIVITKQGQVAVGREPIYVREPTTLVWRLPRLGNLTFARDGIVVRDAPEGEFSCASAEDGKVLTCEDRYTRMGGSKYSVNVLEDGKPLPPLDPFIVNGI